MASFRHARDLQPGFAAWTSLSRRTNIQEDVVGGRGEEKNGWLKCPVSSFKYPTSLDRPRDRLASSHHHVFAARPRTGG